MSASENQCVYLIVFGQYLVDIFFDEIVGTRRFEFIIFNERNPHRASLSDDSDMWKEFVDFDCI